jgi:DMSO/TMAO reductase YedYZ molybdopterin-dependent catalytic subunit
MLRFLRCSFLALFIVLGLAATSGFSQQSVPATAAAPALTSARLTISGDVEHPLSLSLADLSKMPRTTVNVTNSREKKDETFEGVALSGLLKQAGAPQGPKLRGATMATYVIAEAADGYRVIFSLAELDSDFQDSGVIVADRMDGKPLDDNAGPLRLVVPHDKRPARWIRMLQSIKVVTIAK